MPRLYKRRSPEELFWSKVERSGLCWLWTAAVDQDGYGIFSMTLPRGSSTSQRHVRAHRFAWELEHGFVPPGLLMHSCDTPRCVNPAHLSVGTAFENIRDCVAKGRNARGERNVKAKLNSEAAREIRASREPLKVLAAQHGVSESTVRTIRRGITWRHIAPAPTS